jgi:Pilus formation protein N terminal region
MKSGMWSLLAGAATIFVMAGQVYAGQPITLLTDRSTMITVSAEPSTVVVGNPSIADVSLNGKQVFLHGHAFGDTNLTILDANGNVLADFDVTVGNDGPNQIAIFKGGAKVERYSYTCAPYCEVTMQVGDPFGWTDSVVTENSMKNALATGKPTSEAKAPAAPQ